MSSPECEQAIRDAQRVTKAVLKFISPNDVGLTGGHQKGYYLPKAAWQIFTPFPPTSGVNNDHSVEAVWPDGRVTKSTVKWYGTGTRAEYRLTGFNRERDFPFLLDDCVGSLLVLVPERIDRFKMYVLDLEDDIEEIQAALGIELLKTWTVYLGEEAPPPETEDDCINKRFRTFAATLSSFPPTLNFATEAHDALVACVHDFMAEPTDEQLLRCVNSEYALYQLAERKLCEPEIVRVFKSVDDFIKTAQTILQRRKARAGRSLEHHVERLLKDASVPFSARVDVEGTKPDILIPGRKEYLDPTYPDSKLFAVGIKTTCKDRWRQVTREALRVTNKHILTLQKGISPNQLKEMKSSSVTLVVPKGIHGDYPKDSRGELLTIADFVDRVKTTLAKP